MKLEELYEELDQIQACYEMFPDEEEAFNLVMEFIEEIIENWPAEKEAIEVILTRLKAKKEKAEKVKVWDDIKKNGNRRIKNPIEIYRHWYRALLRPAPGLGIGDTPPSPGGCRHRCRHCPQIKKDCWEICGYLYGRDFYLWDKIVEMMVGNFRDFLSCDLDGVAMGDIVI